MKWDYLTYTFTFKKRFASVSSGDELLETSKDGRIPIEIIKQFGQEGWELISVTPLVCTSGSGVGGRTSELLFTFKRPIG